MNIAIISSLGSERAQQCMRSIEQSVSEVPVTIHIIPCKSSREDSLNYAVSVMGTEQDILFVSDDIEFTSGWYEALTEHIDCADIIGMSMVNHSGTLVQSRGYQLVHLDDEVVLEAIDAGLDETEIITDHYQLCDAVSGCFMYVKKDVFRFIPYFAVETSEYTDTQESRVDFERWTEVVFCLEAAKNEFKIANIDHYIYHHQHHSQNDPVLDTASSHYEIEKQLWQRVVQNYVDNERIRVHRCTEISPSLKTQLLYKNQQVLIYGVGQVTKKLLHDLNDAEHVTLCSDEEDAVDKEIDCEVFNLNDINVNSFDWVLITPISQAENIFKKSLLPVMGPAFQGAVSAINAVTDQDRLVYSHYYL